MEKFYFTFGTSKSFPFRGGWVIVYAMNYGNAIEVFRQHHPDRTPGIINCSDIYSEEQFLSSGMADGNLGGKCHAEYWERGLRACLSIET